MTILLDSKFKREFENKKRSLRLPFLAYQLLNESLDILHQAVYSRNWTIPDSKFSCEVKYFSSRHRKLNLNSPRPILKKTITKKDAAELSIKIDSGLNFIELAQGSDPQIKPILLYYSCSQLCGVLTRAFFNWEKDRSSHGITCKPYPKDLSKTKIYLKDRGQFSRVSTTLFLLSGYPSCFSELITYSKPPSTHTNKGELLEIFGSIEKGAPIKELTLDELLNFAYKENLDKVKIRHGFHKFSGLPSTAFLIDFIILFLSSSFSRYYVLSWQKILEGKENPYMFSFDDVFNRYNSYMSDVIIQTLINPFQRLDKSFVPSRVSPYSHRDNTRF